MFGLIAEEVAEVNPDLVARNSQGEPESVHYEMVNAMLLNEFLKARRQIDAQQKQIDALTVGLQKVSAQLEASKPAPQVVNNSTKIADSKQQTHDKNILPLFEIDLLVVRLDHAASDIM